MVLKIPFTRSNSFVLIIITFLLEFSLILNIWVWIDQLLQPFFRKSCVVFLFWFTYRDEQIFTCCEIYLILFLCLSFWERNEMEGKGGGGGGGFILTNLMFFLFYNYFGCHLVLFSFVFYYLVFKLIIL